MRKMTEKQLTKWEKSRDLGQEILQGIRDIKAGSIGRRYTIGSYPIVRAREKSGLSQAKFAQLLGVSIRTIQDWEQGRREPTGPAKALLRAIRNDPQAVISALAA